MSKQILIVETLFKAILRRVQNYDSYLYEVCKMYNADAVVVVS